MSTREGSLEAPTRHPLDWKNPDFYNEDKLMHELERSFDICHGCRRCVSLCTAFPTYSTWWTNPTMEVDGVAKADYMKWSTSTYCDLCYMTKCPTCRRIRGTSTSRTDAACQASSTRRAAPLSETSCCPHRRDGQLASIPVVVQAVNASLKSKPVQAGQACWASTGPQAARIRQREIPFTAKPRGDFAVKAGGPGKVAIYACYVNYNEPGIGHDLLKLLAHNEIPAVLVEKEACCGMPKLELGDFDAVPAEGNQHPYLAKLAREGYAILTAVPHAH
jgi:hypothetical protein